MCCSSSRPRARRCAARQTLCVRACVFARQSVDRVSTRASLKGLRVDGARTGGRLLPEHALGLVVELGVGLPGQAPAVHDLAPVADAEPGQRLVQDAHLLFRPPCRRLRSPSSSSVSPALEPARGPRAQSMAAVPGESVQFHRLALSFVGRSARTAPADRPRAPPPPPPRPPRPAICLESMHASLGNAS